MPPPLCPLIFFPELIVGAKALPDSLTEDMEEDMLATHAGGRAPPP